MRKISLLVCLLIGLFSHAQKINYAAVDSVLQSYTGKSVFNGVVLVAENGKAGYEKAFGYRDFAKQTPLETTDIFELASVSKEFTSMIIMMLKEKGLLNYDDLVEKYVTIPYKGITIRNLLTHTSGLPDYMATMDAHWDKTKVAGNEDILAYLNQYQPPKLFEPGAKYNYSNTGYVVLASVAEKAAGKDFIAMCRENIFRPLHMNNTDIRTAEEKSKIKNFAVGHVYVADKNEFENAELSPSSNYTIWLGNRKGPGRMSSTAEDLLKWDQALYTNQLVSQQTLEDAFTTMRLNDGKISDYGFGWVIIANDPSGKIVWHNGDNPGYKTEIMRFLGKKKTLIVLCNNATDQFANIIKQLQSIITR